MIHHIKMKPIIILSAIPEEIEDFISHYPNIQSQKTGAFTFFHTTEQDQPLILGTSGVGKVAAAMTTQKIIDLYDPRCILFTGLAGALNPAYEIGDLILADRCIQYDIDASELGFPAGTIPYTDYHTFTPDETLLKLAQQIKIRSNPTYRHDSNRRPIYDTRQTRSLSDATRSI